MRAGEGERDAEETTLCLALAHLTLMYLTSTR